MSTPEKPPGLDVSMEDDLLLLRFRCDYDAAVVTYLRAIRATFAERYAYRLILFDVRGAGTVTPEARRMMLAWNKEHSAPNAIAIVGANFAMRTVANLVLSAIRTLTKQELGFSFFETEPEARTWLAAQRSKLVALVGQRREPG